MKSRGCSCFSTYAADLGWRRGARPSLEFLLMIERIAKRCWTAAASIARGAGALSPRADAPARPPRRCDSRAQAPGADRHLHHRSQRQLHERLRRALQLLRVLPAGRLADGYVLGFDEIFRKIDETIAVGGNQLLLQGGHNPDLPIAWYEDLFRAVKQRYPSSSFTRCRHRRFCTLRESISFRFPRSSIGW
jgi:hypothetical protein